MTLGEIVLLDFWTDPWNHIWKMCAVTYRFMTLLTLFVNSVAFGKLDHALQGFYLQFVLAVIFQPDPQVGLEI